MNKDHVVPGILCMWTGMLWIFKNSFSDNASSKSHKCPTPHPSLTHTLSHPTRMGTHPSQVPVVGPQLHIFAHKSNSQRKVLKVIKVLSYNTLSWCSRLCRSLVNDTPSIYTDLHTSPWVWTSSVTNRMRQEKWCVCFVDSAFAPAMM